MTPFEYVSVLISIILGLGITVLLTGLADIIRHWNSIRMYWPYAVWILIVFVLHLQEWWITYSLRSEMHWTLPMFLFIISYPIVLFILAHVLFPKQWSEKRMDLEDHYFDNYRKFFGAALLLIVISMLQNIFILNLPFESQILQSSLALLFGVLLWIRSRHATVHALVALLMLFLLVISFIISPQHLELS